MPGDPREPNQKFGHPSPEQNAAGITAGEFTQIFSGVGPTRPFPESAQSELAEAAQDEFSKLFCLPPSPAAVPAAPPREGTASEATTLIFEALPPASPTSPWPFPEPAATTIPKSEVRVDPPGVLPRQASPSAEFTQVFSPVAPPIFAPAEKSQATSTPGSAGEFTQFFSAISARESLTKAAPAREEAGAQNRLTAYPDATGSVAGSSTAQNSGKGSLRQTTPLPLPSEGGATRSSALPANSALSRDKPSAFASAETQVFHQEAQLAEAPRGMVSNVPAAPIATQAESFTQIFQQIAPPPQEGRRASSPWPAVPVTPAAPVPPASAHNEWPAFGPPPPPSDTFTDVFAAQPQPSSSPSDRPPLSNSSTPQQGGFTELFQARPTSSPWTNDAPYVPPAPTVPGSGRWSPPSQDAPLNPSAGDFTKLMQSLAPGAQPSTSDEAFFAPAHSTGRSQESEFTRIQQASLRRESGIKAPLPASAEPSLAPKEVAAEKKPPAAKQKTLIILLVAMNGLLLLALIAIGYIAMKPK